ncbi:FMN-binding protein [Amnibacterium sp. CER49]|uniref:FMN-binding protein n=1 Tax=Amnibacterium sp. CER49 TaxID=3039161 RepID=UPI00244BBBC4|nr:FMN-binding protein [Amnibacterium sp. CER49]MDH2445174.1 FMN-binding protein [Amnibacterium sp. CER49]
MKRSPVVLAATILGTVGVLLWKPLSASSVEGTSTAPSGTPSSTSSTASSGSSGASSSSSSSSSSSRSGSSGLNATATGALETDRYGDTRVRVVIANGRITDVVVLAYNDGDPRSAEISQAAIPMLEEEVLRKQTAAVDAVSGATYTSNAYLASLQSALDKAGYTAADGSKASTDLSSLDANLGGH